MTLGILLKPKFRPVHAGWREINGKKIYMRSRFEHNYGVYLEFLRKNGSISAWEHEPKTFWFQGIKRGTCSYKPDFEVTENDGRKIWVEVKGYYSKKDFTKIKRFNKYFPKEKIIIIDSEWFKRNRKNLKGLVEGWE